MISLKNRRARSFGLATLAATAALGMGARFAAPPQPVAASDHIDSPALADDQGADLNDTFAFLDPNDNSQVVLIMSTNPFKLSSEIIGHAIFSHNIRYRFEIENTGDAKPDRFIDVTYARGVGRLEPQLATITLPNGQKLKSPVTIATMEDTPPKLLIGTDRQTGVKFFAGAVDDPFFLDNTAANRFVISSIKNPGHPDPSVFKRGRDTYAGFNALVTAVSVPASMLRGRGNVIGINSVTQRRRIQRVLENGQVVGEGEWVTVDRDGTPLINNALIPAPRKDEFNGATTMDDARGRFRLDLIKSMKGLGTDDAHIAMLLKAVADNGDILRLDLTVPNKGEQGGTNKDGGFGKMGGRRLADDVFDGAATILNNGKPLSDNVDANEVPFRNEFPFVADPIQPFPAGNNPEDRTRL